MAKSPQADEQDDSFAVWVSAITLANGGRVALGQGEAIFIVGPNNAGKSTLLREIKQAIELREFQNGKIVRKVEVGGRGTATDFLDYLDQAFIPAGTGDERAFLMPAGGGGDVATRVPDADLKSGFKAEDALKRYPGALIRSLLANNRLTLLEATQIDYNAQTKIHPLHFAYESEPMRKRLADWAMRAFQIEVAINLWAGNALPLHAGPGAALQNGEKHADRSYLARLKGVPQASAQGDGVKSFLGLLLHLVLGHERVAMVDEPEAHLHPPQARLLGRLLIDERAKSAQAFIATHSADVLRGALDSPSGRVRVLRVTRRAHLNDIAELAPEDVREVWQDPVLRYSNVLAGIFHERVVVCEAEGDCMFYSALADALRDSSDHQYLRDVMFVSAGGHGGMAKILRALARLKVSTVAAVDFDVLYSAERVRTLVQALGGAWEPLSADHRTVKQSIDSLVEGARWSVKSRLQSLVDGIDDTAEAIPQAIRRKIIDAMKTPKGWSRSKSSGLALLEKGVEQGAGERLLEGLLAVGIAIVPSGELESFVKSEAAGKNRWVANVLETYKGRMAEATELAGARDYVKKLIRISQAS